MKAKEITLRLPESLHGWVTAQAAGAGFADPASYVEALLASHCEGLRPTLRDRLLEGLQSGEPMPATSDFWKELRKEMEDAAARASRP